MGCSIFRVVLKCIWVLKWHFWETNGGLVQKRVDTFLVPEKWSYLPFSTPLLELTIIHQVERHNNVYILVTHACLIWQQVAYQGAKYITIIHQIQAGPPLGGDNMSGASLSEGPPSAKGLKAVKGPPPPPPLRQKNTNLAGPPQPRARGPKMKSGRTQRAQSVTDLEP